MEAGLGTIDDMTCESTGGHQFCWVCGSSIDMQQEHFSVLAKVQMVHLDMVTGLIAPALV